MGFTLRNAAWSTLTGGPYASGATSVTVATGDGTKFGSPSVANPVRCVIVDTSTTPETPKEFVDVTGVSTDTLTIARAVEDATRFPAASLSTGWYIAPAMTAAVEPHYPDGTTYAYTTPRPRLLDVRDYGWVGDGSTNNSGQVSALQTAVGAGGSVEVLFPKGAYLSSTGLDFHATTQVHLIGESSKLDRKQVQRAGDQTPQSEFRYTSNTGTAIDAHDTSSFGIRGLAVRFSGGNSFTGTLLDATSSSVVPATDLTLRDFLLAGSQDAQGGAGSYGLLLDGHVEPSIEDGAFAHTDYGIQGQKTASSQGFSNALRAARVRFVDYRTGAMQNPGEQWMFSQCVFEPRYGSVVGRAVDVTINNVTPGMQTNLVFVGCGFWDCTSGTWFNFSTGTQYGLAVIGCDVYCSGMTVFNLNSAAGLKVAGNVFNGNSSTTLFATTFGIQAHDVAGNWLEGGVKNNLGGLGTSSIPVWRDCIESVVSVTGNYTAARGQTVLGNANSAAFTVTLPSVATAGSKVTVKKTDSSANGVTISPASGTIDGASTKVITMQYQSFDVVSDGTNWHVV